MMMTTNSIIPTKFSSARGEPSIHKWSPIMISITHVLDRLLLQIKVNFTAVQEMSFTHTVLIHLKLSFK